MGFKEVFKKDLKLNIVFEFIEKTILDDIEKSPSGLDLETIQKYIY